MKALQKVLCEDLGPGAKTLELELVRVASVEQELSLEEQRRVELVQKMMEWSSCSHHMERSSPQIEHAEKCIYDQWRHGDTDMHSD